MKRFVLIFALLAGCGATPSDRPLTVRVGYIPIADCAHLYVASDQGLWASHGLAVEEKSMAGGARLIEALAADALDVAFSNVVSIAVARSRGLDLRVVGGAVVEDADHQPHRLLLPAGRAHAGPSDLRGARIALNTLNNIDYMVMAEYLARGGVGIGEVTLREIPFQRMEGVLASGEIDAASGIEPYVRLSERNPEVARGENPYLSLAPRTLISTYVMRADKAAAPLGREVASVLAEAAAWIAVHDAETRVLVATQTHIDPSVTASMGMARMEPRPQAEDLQRMMDRARTAGLLGDPVPTALDLLGP